jgi:hypothetical protein
MLSDKDQKDSAGLQALPQQQGHALQARIDIEWVTA